jgi:hypothetical protein
LTIDNSIFSDTAPVSLDITLVDHAFHSINAPSCWSGARVTSALLSAICIVAIAAG